MALQDSEHQSGYLRTIGAVRGELATEPSVAEALEWALRTFVIGPHEVIAYSKLPESPSASAGRRVDSGLSAGHDRFTTSGARRGAMSSLCEDMGLWARTSKDETPHLTEVGRAFVARVFR